MWQKEKEAIQPSANNPPAAYSTIRQPCWPLQAMVLRTTQPQHFGSGDSCGDWIVEWGPEGWFQLQVANTVSSLCYLVAGLQILACTEAPLARAYGLVNCFVALGAIGLHATSTVVGFAGDIVTIAATMVLLMNGAVRAALAASGRSSPTLVRSKDH